MAFILLVPTNNHRLFAAALRYKGICEVPGPKSHKLIQGWIKQAASWLDGDDSKTAWCGCFRGGIGLETGTGVPPAHYRAKSWLQWGIEIDHTRPALWLQGDTVIMQRPGGAHVTLFDRQRNTNLPSAYFLGGNQSDQVMSASYLLTRVIGVRRAPDL